MGTVSKCRNDIDRLSNLPTSLIDHILSFMPIKDVVKTSVLSTQWVHQWTSITHLEFDDGHPMRNESSYTTTTQSSFVHFVYRVLLYKATSLDSFRLKCGKDYGGSHVQSWIAAALLRHVREIDLTVPKDDICLPPPPWSLLELDCLFSSKTLVVLKLGRGFLLRVPDIISLASLKILHFSSVEFEHYEALMQILSSCPLIEELKLEGELCESTDILPLYITSPVLKRLILNGLYSQPCCYFLILNTPNLEYLEHIDDGVPDGYRVEGEMLLCLERAHLCLNLTSDQYEYYDNSDLFLQKSIAHLVIAISNVRYLHLSEYAFEAFYHPECVMPNFELPKFPRLTDLTIDSITLDEGLSLLIAFLQNSPQLTSLSFHLDNEILQEVWNPPTEVPFCMQHTLNVIEVADFCGLPLELAMVKYFLEKTISLKEIILTDVQGRISEVLMLPKASKSCKIVII